MRSASHFIPRLFVSLQRASLLPNSRLISSVVCVTSDKESGSPFANHVFVGQQHSFLVDEPPSLGGNDLGPNPYDLILSGLGACTSMTLTMYAHRKGIPLEGIEVKLEHSKIHAKDCEECMAAASAKPPSQMLDYIVREITLVGDLTEAQCTRMLQIANMCPVHRTLESEHMQIETRLVNNN